MKLSKILMALIVLISVSACHNDSKEPEKTTQEPQESRKPRKETKKYDYENQYQLSYFMKFDSEETLKKEFGSQVESIKEWREEGTVEYAISKIKFDEGSELLIIWKEKDTKSMVHEIILRGTKNKYKTSSGIALGMSLKAIEKLNGAPFQFYGFGWDASGSVVFEKGKLESSSEQIILHYPMEDLPKEYRSLVGDRLIPSSDPLAQKLNPIIREIVVKSVRL